MRASERELEGPRSICVPETFSVQGDCCSFSFVSKHFELKVLHLHTVHLGMSSTGSCSRY